MSVNVWFRHHSSKRAMLSELLAVCQRQTHRYGLKRTSQRLGAHLAGGVVCGFRNAPVSGCPQCSISVHVEPEGEEPRLRDICVSVRYDVEETANMSSFCSGRWKNLLVRQH